MAPWGHPDAYDRRICEDGNLRTFTYTGPSQWEDVDKGYVTAKDEMTGKWHKVVGHSSGNRFVASRRGKNAHLVCPDIPRPDPKGPFFLKENTLTAQERAEAMRIPLGPPGKGGGEVRKDYTSDELKDIFGIAD